LRIDCLFDGAIKWGRMTHEDADDKMLFFAQ